MTITYKGTNVGVRRVDLFIESEILIDLKALIDLDDVHIAQAMNYLEAYQLRVGLLINFGSKSLQFKRIQNNNYNKIK